MASHRWAYAAFFIAAFFYYVFHTAYVSWAVFVVVVALPFISVLITFVLGRGGHTIAIRGEAMRQEALYGIRIGVEFGAASPAMHARLRLVMKNLMTGKVHEQKVILSAGKQFSVWYESDLCGVIRMEVKKPRILDILGLVGMPARQCSPVEALVLPEEIPCGDDVLGMLQHSEPTAEDDPKAASGDFIGREWKDTRDYRQGDMIRDVHWKLTARRGKPVVREYEAIPDKHAKIAVQSGATPREAHDTFARLLGVVRYLREKGYKLDILWWNEAGILQEYNIASERTMLAAFSGMMGQRCGKRAGAGAYPHGSLLVSHNAVVPYGEYLRQEVVV